MKQVAGSAEEATVSPTDVVGAYRRHGMVLARQSGPRAVGSARGCQPEVINQQLVLEHYRYVRKVGQAYLRGLRAGIHSPHVFAQLRRLVPARDLQIRFVGIGPIETFLMAMMGGVMLNRFLHYLFTPSAWTWPHALIIGGAALLALMYIGARIESRYQRRARQRGAAWADPGCRIRFATQDFKGRSTNHG